MVSWGKAFKGALAIAFFTIFWIVLGIFLIIVGISVGGIGFYEILRGDIQFLGNVATLAGLGILILGLILVIFGFLASYLKVLSEITAEEVLRKIAPRLRGQRVVRQKAAPRPSEGAYREPRPPPPPPPYS